MLPGRFVPYSVEATRNIAFVWARRTFKLTPEDAATLSEDGTRIAVLRWNRIAHGGIVATILDETMGWAGIYLLEQLTLTKTMTIDFTKAVMVGEELRCEAWVQERTGKREAIIHAVIYNAENEICAQSKSTFTMLTLALARRIKLTDEAFEKSFFNPLMESKR
jgi:uncharacterized protein (TIGR00369 family)